MSAGSTRPLALGAGFLAITLLLSAAPARAAEPSPPPRGSAGARVLGVVMMVVGGAGAAVGTAILIGRAATKDTSSTGIPGLGGSSGRSPALDDAGGALLGGGALLVGGGIGVYVYGSHGADDDAPPKPSQARIEPVLAPGFGGLRVRF
jgi:hypothetical protein